MCVSDFISEKYASGSKYVLLCLFNPLVCFLICDTEKQSDTDLLPEAYFSIRDDTY